MTWRPPVDCWAHWRCSARVRFPRAAYEIRRNLLAVYLIKASAYRPLSAFKTYKITDIVKHDRSFAAGCLCLFPIANGALFVQKELGFSVMVMVRDSVRVRVCRHIGHYKSDSGRYADTLMSYTLTTGWAKTVRPQTHGHNSVKS